MPRRLATALALVWLLAAPAAATLPLGPGTAFTIAPAVSGLRLEWSYGADDDVLTVPLGGGAIAIDSDFDGVPGTVVTFAALGGGLSLASPPATMDAKDAWDVAAAAPLQLVVDRSGEAFPLLGAKSSLSIAVPEEGLSVGFSAQPGALSDDQPVQVRVDGKLMRAAEGVTRFTGALHHDWSGAGGRAFGFGLEHQGEDVWLDVDETGQPPVSDYTLDVQFSESKTSGAATKEARVLWTAPNDRDAVLALGDLRLEADPLPQTTGVVARNTNETLAGGWRDSYTVQVESSAGHTLTLTGEGLDGSVRVQDLPPSYEVAYEAARTDATESWRAHYRNPIASTDAGSASARLKADFGLGDDGRGLVEAVGIPEGIVAVAFARDRAPAPGEQPRITASLDVEADDPDSTAITSVGAIHVSIKHDGHYYNASALRLQSAAFDFNPALRAVSLERLSTDNGKLAWSMHNLTKGSIDLAGTSTVTGRLDWSSNLTVDLHTVSDAYRPLSKPIRSLNVELLQLPQVCTPVGIKATNLADAALGVSFHMVTNATAEEAAADPAGAADADPCAASGGGGGGGGGGSAGSFKEMDLTVSLDAGLSFSDDGGDFQVSGLEDKFGVTFGVDDLRAITYRLDAHAVTKDGVHADGEIDVRVAPLRNPSISAHSMTAADIRFKPPAPAMEVLGNTWAAPVYLVEHSFSMAAGGPLASGDMTYHLEHWIDPAESLVVVEVEGGRPLFYKCGYECTVFELFCEEWYGWETTCPEEDITLNAGSTRCHTTPLERDFFGYASYNVPTTVCVMTPAERNAAGIRPATTRSAVSPSLPGADELVDPMAADHARRELFHDYRDAKRHLCWGIAVVRNAYETAGGSPSTFDPFVPCDPPACYDEDPLWEFLLTGAWPAPHPGCVPEPCWGPAQNVSLDSVAEHCFNHWVCDGWLVNMTFRPEECVPDTCAEEPEDPACVPCDNCTEPPCSPDCVPPPPCTTECLPPPPCTTECLPPPPCTVDCLPPPPCTVDCLPPPPCDLDCVPDPCTSVSPPPPGPCGPAPDPCSLVGPAPPGLCGPIPVPTCQDVRDQVPVTTTVDPCDVPTCDEAMDSVTVDPGVTTPGFDPCHPDNPCQPLSECTGGIPTCEEVWGQVWAGGPSSLDVDPCDPDNPCQPLSECTGGIPTCEEVWGQLGVVLPATLGVDPCDPDNPCQPLSECTGGIPTCDELWGEVGFTTVLGLDPCHPENPCRELDDCVPTCEEIRDQVQLDPGDEAGGDKGPDPCNPENPCQPVQSCTDDLPTCDELWGEVGFTTVLGVHPCHPENPCRQLNDCVPTCEEIRDQVQLDPGDEAGGDKGPDPCNPENPCQPVQSCIPQPPGCEDLPRQLQQTCNGGVPDPCGTFETLPTCRGQQGAAPPGGPSGGAGSPASAPPEGWPLPAWAWPGAWSPSSLLPWA